jgi:hypothetical protein
MQPVLSGTFPCPICKRDRTFQVFGLLAPEERPRVLKDATEFARHQHWCDAHRLCAVCGKYVKSGESGDLECAVNDGQIRIHPDYNDYFLKVERGDISRLLIVHKACIEEKSEG